MKKDYLGRVQALRFFAAFAVLLAHVQHEVAERLMPGHPFSQITLIDGGIGVDIFFLISGFIMYYVSGASFGTPGASRNFAERRFLRVAPLYYVATLLLLLAGTLVAGSVEAGRPSAGRLLSTFLFVPYIDATGSSTPILKLGWTLNYEAYFYAVFAIALAFRRTVGIAILFGSIIAVVALATIAPGFATVIDVWGNSIVLEFLGGVAIAVAYRRGTRLTHSLAWVLIATGLLLVMTLRWFHLNSYMPRCMFHGLPAGMIVAGVALRPARRAHGRAARWLEIGGDASYALYLFHPFAIRAATLAWHRLGGPPMPWLLITGIVVVAVALSVAVNSLIEKPLDRWLQQRFGHRRAPLATTI